MTVVNPTPEQEMLQRYRNVFGTSEGHLVLGDIIRLGHVFDNIDPHDPVLVTERNFALTIARMASAFDMVYPTLGLDHSHTP